MIEKLYNTNSITYSQLINIINDTSSDLLAELMHYARLTCDKYYQNNVYFRGLIEISSYCKQNCNYCGLRAQNSNAQRYRLSKKQILGCCAAGYSLGFRTFVLQGGEDPFFTKDILCDIVTAIKTAYPDCAITLSVGEWDKESYKAFFSAGADRYLLRHETATKHHYQLLHPDTMSFENRRECIQNLKEIGFQVGAGFMVGSPYQTTENLANDLLYLQAEKPHMIGIGPFISHHDTPFANYPSGSLSQVLKMVSLTRLLLPKSLIPSTTALASIDENGRILGLKAGANVIMPNLSPVDYRKSYSIYDNKKSLGAEAAEGLYKLKQELEANGFILASGRGDYCGM